MIKALRSREGRELDLTAVLCLAPSVLYVVGMFVYPFLHGIYLSLRPPKQTGLSLANYVAFFSDEWQYGTIWITFSIAIPTTLIVVSTALFLAYGMRRGIRMERTITTILVLPVSLGVILLSIGIQGFYGSRGWFNQFLIGSGLLSEPLQLTNNKTGVMLSLFMQQFPFCFLMLLGYISGIDPTLEKSARTLGAGPWAVFRRVMLPLMAPGIAIAFALVFVMSFAVFPSAILLGQPAGSTRTIAIAAYHQAFEHYDMSYASAIAVIMGLCQLAGLALIVLLRQRMITAPTMGVGKR
jgi:putative spermidine/putrescine transport system permease protein